ncbi:MAG TPA: C40 family peptidase [Gaiellaceae bacterium]|nr:C40 family peptidase [Gaiellaceae bacterium]
MRTLCLLACVLSVLVVCGPVQATPKRAAAKRSHRVWLRRVQLRRTNYVVRLAWRAVGARYRWGGASPRAGFDCSGLTRWVYGHVGVSLPHYTRAQWRYGRPVARRRLAPGDLVFFAGFSHVGIYVGRGAMIDAPHPGARVRFERISGWFAANYTGARRLAP